jgi:hypothetical protein
MEVFWAIVKVISKLGKDFQGVENEKEDSEDTSSASYRIPNPKSTVEFYRKIATQMVATWIYELKPSVSRGGGWFDSNDYIVTIGYTIGGSEQNLKPKKNPYREHVVPCDYIMHMGFDICDRVFGEAYGQKYKNGRPPAGLIGSSEYKKVANKAIAEIWQMVQRNLAIVLCSDEERKILDMYNKWQSTMPPGWKDGDDILARFKEARIPDSNKIGIPVYSFNEGNKRIAEE